MSAVVSFVEDVVEGVGDAVGDVFEAVGDVVEDVVDFAGDVVDKVGDVVQAVIDDPLPVLLSVAGQMVGIPAPLTMGALTAARGGDLEDIALSMGTAYFAPQVGSAISSTVTTTFIEAGINETFSQVAAESISKGLVNGTVAEIKGGNFDDGFAGGFTGGMVAGGVNEVASYVQPDVIQMAEESGIDLKDANRIFNAGKSAVTAGVTAEVTGRGDFATSFTNSAVGSSIDAGTRSLNATIDEQFRTAATDWNAKDKEGEPVDVSTTGAGIPNEVVGQVTVSGYGVDNTPSTLDTASVLEDSQEANNATSSYTGERAVSDVAVLPETNLAEAPKAETTADFADLLGSEKPASAESVLAESVEVPSEVSDIAQTVASSTETPVEAPVETQGALATLAEASKPVEVASAPATDVAVAAEAPVTEAPIASNLLTTGMPVEQPVGGLNAVAKTADQKMADSLGLKPTDITKPIVATVGNLLKSMLKQGTKPQPRPVVKKPVGALPAMAGVARPKPMPPARVDVSKLTPIQKATPVAPPKTLPSTAKLSPVSNIAGLTSLVKKTG